MESDSCAHVHPRALQAEGAACARALRQECVGSSRKAGGRSAE